MTETQRRIRAARAYSGMTLNELADAVGMGRMTLYRMENGQRDVKRMELREIAEACDVPYEFFAADWATLGDDAGQLDRIEQKLDRIIQTADAFDRTIGATAPDGETLLEILQRATAEQLQPPEDARTQESRKQPAAPPRRRQAARKTA